MIGVLNLSFVYFGACSVSSDLHTETVYIGESKMTNFIYSVLEYLFSDQKSF